MEAADRAAEERADVSRAADRRWWRLVPRVVTHPREVFVALRSDDETDVNARSEPILAIVLLAGIAGILLTPAWGAYLDDESIDWLTLAVVTFIGGLLYGAFGYYLLGFVVWLGTRGVGVDTRARKTRQVVGFSALPLALSLLVTLPAILFAFGLDWHAPRRLRRRPRSRTRPARRSRVRGLGARPARTRAANDVPPAVARRRGRDRARGGVLVAVVAVVPTVL